MNFGDILTVTIVMGTIVALVGILAGAYKRRLAYLERKFELAAGAIPVPERESQLENRVRVLERIVTEGNDAGAIARQIEALRSSDALPFLTEHREEVTTQ